MPAARPVRLRRPQGRRARHAALPAAEPARPASPTRPRLGAEDQPDLALEGGILGLLGAAVRPARTPPPPPSPPVPATRKEAARRGRSRCPPRAHRATLPPAGNPRTRRNRQKPARHDQ